MSKTTRREFLKIGLAAAGGALAASGVEIPLFSGNNSSIQTQLNNANTQVTNLQNQLKTVTGFLTLNINEQALLEPIVETIIPSDSTGPGAKEAGVIYFIDRQLAGDYGQSANMFMEGPFIPPKVPASTTSPLTVSPSAAWAALPLPVGGGGSSTAIVYPGGTASVRVGSGINYQYPLNLRAFWKAGLEAVQNYAKSTMPYQAPFQNLSAANQLAVLGDLWAGKATTFADNYGTKINPVDFAYELSFMTWAGFTMDPLYGGNQNMVGWAYMGFNGVNLGNAYGEGLSQKNLMVATTPTRLKPASLAQYQQAAKGGA
jgi:gluconate 2-dehydrogenase gamma chain